MASGRVWTMWTDRKARLAKFKASVLMALEFHANEYDANLNAPTQLQIIANDIMVERKAALDAITAVVARQANHQGLLLAANHGMGLIPPG